MMMGTIDAGAQQDAALSAKVIAWASQNIAAFQKAADYAHHKQHPTVPVPPQVDMPCHLCGDTSQTQGEAQVAAWVKQAQEPENTYMQTILSDGRQVALLGGANSDLLSPAAQKALRSFDDDTQAITDAASIASVLVNEKAGPMVQQYGKDPKRAYAGIMFLLSAGKTLALLGGSNSGGIQEQLLQDAETWEQSISDTIQSDVLSGHKYNLCPVYAEIVRSVVLLGGQEPQNMDQYQQMLLKLQDLVKFNVNIDLKVMIDTPDGSHMHADWKGKAKLTLNLDLGKSCYTPVFDNGGQLAVTVANWDMIAVSKKSDGSTETTPVQLTSSHSYNAPLGMPQLNLCDPQPLFQMPTPTSYPPEEIMAKGHTQKTVLFGSFLSAVVATNEVNSGATNAVTGGAPTLPGGGPPPADSGSGSGASGMDADKQALDAHKGDVNWLMSPAGQAVIADMQKQALQTVQSKIASAGVVVPNASNFTQLAQSMTSAHVPWTNGQAQPVNKTLHVKKDTADITLTISVQQAAQ
jgi:hypothetical protein